jgi:hypothetical protein
MTTDQLTPGQRAGLSATTFLDTGGWGYGVGVREGSTGRRYGWGGGLGTLWYSWEQWLASTRKAPAKVIDPQAPKPDEREPRLIHARCRDRSSPALLPAYEPAGLA